MTFLEIQDLLENRVSLKRHMTFHVAEWFAGASSPPGVLVELETFREDAYDPARCIVVSHTERLSPETAHAYGQRDVLNFAFGMMQYLETHELTEWFKLDGVHVYEPHPPHPPDVATHEQTTEA